MEQFKILRKRTETSNKHFSCFNSYVPSTKVKKYLTKWIPWIISKNIYLVNNMQKIWEKVKILSEVQEIFKNQHIIILCTYLGGGPCGVRDWVCGCIEREVFYQERWTVGTHSHPYRQAHTTHHHTPCPTPLSPTGEMALAFELMGSKRALCQESSSQHSAASPTWRFCN